MHEQDLSSEPREHFSAVIAYHWSQGASLLNKRLSKGIEPSEKDALWGCACLLGALSFASCNATTPEEAWPLKKISPSDLNWLNMTEGKKVIWKIANPTRPESVFYPMTLNFMQFATSSPYETELQRLPIELLELCQLVHPSTPDSHPYLAPASFLAQMIGVKCCAENVGTFMCFFGSLSTEFKQILGQKDAGALVIMAYWYAMISHLKEWWMWRRAGLECQAICKYLLLYHGEDENIRRLLQMIESTCLPFKQDG